MMRGTPDMLVGLSQVAFERNDLEAAAELLSRAEELGEPHGSASAPVPQAGRTRPAPRGGGRPGRRGHAARRRRAGVRRRLLPERATGAGDARASARGAGSARRGRRVGEREPAFRRTTTSPTSASTSTSPWPGSCCTSTRPSRRGGSCVRRTGCSSVSGSPPRSGGRVGTLIEILSPGGACAPRAAGPSWNSALRLAEPEGYVRVFVDEGAPMATLLDVLSRQQPSWSYPRRLLDALGAGRRRASAPASGGPAQRARAGRAPAPRLATSTARPSPASSWCRSTPCARTPRTSTPSSASTAAGPR